MTISPANMRRVFTPLANKQFPVSSDKHARLRSTPEASPTRTPTTLIQSLPPGHKPRLLAPIGVLVTPTTHRYLNRRARAAGKSCGRAAGILAHWALTMNPLAPPPRTRSREKRSKMLNVSLDTDTYDRFRHYAMTHNCALSGALRHLLEWAQHIEETSEHKAYID